MRYVISGELNPEPDLFVVGTARTPEELAHKRTMLRPSLVVMDLESQSDLLELTRISVTSKLPSLALCAPTQGGAQLAFAALEAGISDFVARSNGDVGRVRFAPDLRHKVRGLVGVKPCVQDLQFSRLEPRKKTTPRPLAPEHSLIVITCSTGGLVPLTQLLTALPGHLPASILILASMPEKILDWYSSQIDPTTAYVLQKANDGTLLQTGVACFVPCECRVTIGPDDRLELERGALHGDSYLAADTVLASAAKRYGPGVLGVVFSGIGQDGVKGALDVRAAGGTVIVQELATCVAAETPSAVIEAGGATIILPAEQLVNEITRRVSSF
jgi:two-component system chemotaxis response regulator CheB